jgi:uncharacterized protein YceH (UPF0502 family)
MQLPSLTSEELRVLGALIEKSKTTPDYYPMTVNAITAACNQKTSRNPVVEYSEETVQQTLNSLKAQSLVSTAVGGGSRVVKYKHNFTTVYPLSDAELAILCLLFLRGPQTAGEINTNSSRLHIFASLESVYENLQNMSQGDSPFVKELPRRAGQKESRFMHLLGGDLIIEEQTTYETRQTENVSRNSEHHAKLEERVSNLEMEVSRLKEILDKLMN